MSKKMAWWSWGGKQGSTVQKLCKRGKTAFFMDFRI